MKTLIKTLVRNVLDKRFLFTGTPVEVESARERVLLVVSWMSSIVVLCLSFLVVYKTISAGNLYHGVSFTLFLSLLFVFIGCIYLINRGYLLTSSITLIIIYLAGSVATAIYWGFDVPTATLGYVLVILITSMLLGSRAGLFMTLGLVLFIIFLGYLQITYIPWDNTWRLESPEMIDTITYSIIFFGVMSLSWLINSEKDKVLKKLFLSENDLRIERDNLEIIVEKRTFELRKSELERRKQDKNIIEYGKRASGILHDIASPFTSLQYYFEKIESNNIPSIQEHMSELGLAMKTINNFFQAFTQSSITRKSNVTFKIEDQISTIIRLETPSIQKRKIKIDTEYNHTNLLYGSDLGFYQIIKNVISNNIEAFEQESENNLILIKTNQDSENINIEIYNNGPKIPDFIGDRIFEPFFTTKEKQGGSGIGLFGAKTIIENQFSGTISYMNSQNKCGVTFFMRFKV